MIFHHFWTLKNHPKTLFLGVAFLRIFVFFGTRSGNLADRPLGPLWDHFWSPFGPLWEPFGTTFWWFSVSNWVNKCSRSLTNVDSAFWTQPNNPTTQQSNNPTTQLSNNPTTQQANCSSQLSPAVCAKRLNKSSRILLKLTNAVPWQTGSSSYVDMCIP